MAYTRRQELVCTEAQMNAKPNVILRANEVIYITMNDGTTRQKMGDGTTPIIDLPFTKVFDGNVAQTLGDNPADAISQKVVTDEFKAVHNDIKNQSIKQTFSGASNYYVTPCNGNDIEIFDFDATKETSYEVVACGVNVWRYGDILSTPTSIASYANNIFALMNPDTPYVLHWDFVSDGTENAYSNKIIVYYGNGGLTIENGKWFSITQEMKDTFQTAYAYFNDGATEGRYSNIQLQVGYAYTQYEEYRQNSVIVDINTPRPIKLKSFFGVTNIISPYSISAEVQLDPKLYVEYKINEAHTKNLTGYGLPVLNLFGDISEMTKDNAVPLTYVYGDKSGACEVKWQGTSSIGYPKKNYTIKFDFPFEAAEGWGVQKKYCLKANYIDFSHSRNIVSAKLWGDVVKARRSTKNLFVPNYSAFVNGVQSVNGLTLTANADGSVTVTGTATAWSHITLQENLYAGATSTATNGSNADNYNDECVFSVFNENGVFPSGLEWFGYDPNTHMAFIRVEQGNTINDTLYFQIEKGTIATSWEAPFSAYTRTLRTLPNGGGIDGFPVIMFINGAYQGIYTFNIPKDGWMFGMGSASYEGIVCAEADWNGSLLKAEVLCDGSDFSIEYATDENNTTWIPASLNTLIKALNNSNGADLDTTIAQYLDWDSAIDYLASSLLFNNFDGVAKNYLLATFDGVKWLFSAYDMDSTFGLWWTGREFMNASTHPSAVISSFRQHKVFDMICNYKKEQFKARYKTLRDGVLSEDAVATRFANFVTQIPKGLFDYEVEVWTGIPSTSTNNLSQIVDFYRRRCEYVDKVIDEL